MVTVHPCREVTAAEAWDSWSQRIHSQRQREMSLSIGAWLAFILGGNDALHLLLGSSRVSEAIQDSPSSDRPMGQPDLDDPSLKPFPSDARLCRVDNENLTTTQILPSQQNPLESFRNTTQHKCGFCIQETPVLVGVPSLSL